MDLTFTPLDPAAHAELLHGWLTTDRARFWGMTAHSPAQVRAYLERVDASADEQGWIGSRAGTPLVYVETYDPARLFPDGLLAPEPGDLGMHLLIAPPAGEPAHGLTAAVMGEVVSWCLHERGAARVVVEPDERNRAVLAKNAAAGFRVLQHVEIPDGEGTKRAALSVCTQADFAASPLGPGTTSTAHLRPDIAEIGRAHV